MPHLLISSFSVFVHHDDAYGLSITHSIEEKLQRKVSLSSVHTALYRLEEKGFLKSEVGGVTKERGGRRKRLFKITSLGLSRSDMEPDPKDFI